MKLYDKKFLIYGNCMIRSFAQPGYSLSIHDTFIITTRVKKSGRLTSGQTVNHCSENMSAVFHTAVVAF